MWPMSRSDLGIHEDKEAPGGWRREGMTLEQQAYYALVAMRKELNRYRDRYGSIDKATIRAQKLGADAIARTCYDGGLNDEG